MAEEKGRTKVQASAGALTIDFELDKEQQKAVAECLARTGKLTLNLRKAGVSKLPGRGLLDDVDGELID
jgi:hypothetical protein